jgi:hypothetical protein
METSSAATPEPRDWKRVLDFIHEQGERDRSYFKHLFNWSAGAVMALITIAAAVTAFFVGRTLSDVRALTNSEVERMRTTVRERIEAEFQTERIRDTVRQVVASKTSQELESLIRQKVNRRVADELKRQRSAIDRAVAAETSRQISLRAIPRDLEELMRENFLQSVKRKPQPKLYIGCVGQEGSEPFRYAQQYAEIFKKAGWREVVVRSIEKSPSRSADLVLLTSDPLGHPSVAVAIIKEAFQNTFSWEIPVERDALGPHDAPHLIIPVKPL